MRAGARVLGATLLSVLVASTGIVALGLNSGAAWAGPKFRPITCTAASQLNTSAPIVVSGCQRRMLTGGTGAIQGNGVNGQNVLTWRTGKSLTFSRDSATPVSPSPCPSGTAEVDFRGTVLSTSGRTTASFVGKKVAFDACLTVGLSVVVVELVPATTFTVS